jgi:hypothetical protein
MTIKYLLQYVRKMNKYRVKIRQGQVILGRRLMFRIIVQLSLIVLFLGGAVWGEDAIAVSDSGQSPVKKISESLYEIGNIRLDLHAGRLSMAGWVNMDRGTVEYFAVAPGGKTHESVLVLDINPLYLQVALLLAGLDYGQNLAFQGDTTMPEGDSVEAFVQWVDSEGDTAFYPASELVYDLMNKVPMSDNWWVFTGSFIYDKQIAAQLEGSLIATFSDPVAILNSTFWGRGDDTVYGINEEVIPAAGTPIQMIIQFDKSKSEKGDTQ